MIPAYQAQLPSFVNAWRRQADVQNCKTKTLALGGLGCYR
jgi:hypothetical protein